MIMHIFSPYENRSVFRIALCEKDEKIVSGKSEKRPQKERPLQSLFYFAADE